VDCEADAGGCYCCWGSTGNLGRGDRLGAGGWVRREIRRLKQNDGASS